MTKECIIAWFCEKGILKEDIERNMDANYLEQGYIDSLGFLELITMCEKIFHIDFKDDDFTDEKIFTINGMIQVIERKL